MTSLENIGVTPGLFLLIRIHLDSVGKYEDIRKSEKENKFLCIYNYYHKKNSALLKSGFSCPITK